MARGGARIWGESNDPFLDTITGEVAFYPMCEMLIDKRSLTVGNALV